MTKIKICGTTNLEDALKIAELGADYIGFIFYPKSPRFVEPKVAAEIISKLPSSIKTVGVFVNQSVEGIEQVVKACNLAYVQLHGDETPGFAEKISVPVIKAFRIKNGVFGEPALQMVNQYRGNIFAYLFDAHVEGAFGGTGQTFDISILKDKHFDKPIFLSGGLNPENVANAVSKIKPYAVDVCSGVESTPGKKDYRKLKLFIKTVLASN